MTDEWIKAAIDAAFRKRDENGGRHLHHSACIHNLPPEEQVGRRGKTVEWWTTCVGSLPVQITPEQWETEPPDFDAALALHRDAAERVVAALGDQGEEG